MRWNDRKLGFHSLDCLNSRHRSCGGRSKLSGTTCCCDCHVRTWRRGYLVNKAIDRLPRRGWGW